MGRRKGKINQMGNSLLVKDKNRRPGRRGDSETFLHTTDLQDGVDYNRINFQSVTEQSNLEDFLNTAELAGRDFTAERQNISIITNPGQGIQLTNDDIKKISQAQQQHRQLLRIPRRPHWDEFTTKEELLQMERDSFTTWRRQLKILEDQEHIELTPYEKNLDFWRQLWRVIERSDVVVQIVDARNPLLFHCEDLETYTKEVSKEKTFMLLINKSDYLNECQRTCWMEYFNNHGIQAVFFSAKTETEKHEEPDVDMHNRRHDDIDTIEEDDGETDSDENDDRSLSEQKESNIEPTDKSEASSVTQSSEANTTATVGEKSIKNSVPNCDNIDINSLSINQSSGEYSANSIGKYAQDQDKLENSSLSSQDIKEGSNKKAFLLLENSTDIVSADELLNIFRKLSHPSVTARAGEIKTVGMVGYPNVGKSSTINVILKEKKLAVSATPGRTKHLQTLFVDESLMLCDCPGLVFPSFVATKAHLVVNGILPIDELRDHVSPTNLICDHIPRSVLEATYSIMIPRPSSDDNPDRPPTVEELLNAYGSMRGFMTPRGIPDGPRASRYLLKDYVKGKLLYCNPPPGFSGQEFQDENRVQELEAARPVIKAPPPRIQSDVDKEFFQKRESQINSKGISGVKQFVRVDCLRPTSRDVIGPDGSIAGSTAGSIAGSSMSLDSCAAGVNKPWKKHNNRNKKEKLRRLHKDLDIH